jgi:hypothetical protein
LDLRDQNRSDHQDDDQRQKKSRYRIHELILLVKMTTDGASRPDRVKRSMSGLPQNEKEIAHCQHESKGKPL